MMVLPTVVPLPAVTDDASLSMEPYSSSDPVTTTENSVVAAFVKSGELSKILIDIHK